MTDPMVPPVADPPGNPPAPPAPPVPPTPEPPSPPEPVKTGEPPKPPRPFDPEMFDKVFELYPEQIKDKLGVTALECANARQRAVIEDKLTPEEAAALPGKTAAEITAAAKVTSGIIAKRLEAAKTEFQERKSEPAPFYRLPSETEAAKETDPAKRAMNEYAQIMGK